MVEIEKVISGDHLLAKYVMRRKELREDGKLKQQQLSRQPPKALSFMEVSGLRHSDICAHGKQYVDNPDSDRKIIGYCLFRADTMLRLKLQVEYDNDPERHVSVYFPEDLAKRKLLGKALEAQCEKFAHDGRSMLYFHDCECSDTTECA